MASANESVAFSTASSRFEEVVSCGGLEAASEVRSRTKGSDVVDMMATRNYCIAVMC